MEILAVDVTSHPPEEPPQRDVAVSGSLQLLQQQVHVLQADPFLQELRTQLSEQVSRPLLAAQNQTVTSAYFQLISV